MKRFFVLAALFCGIFTISAEKGNVYTDIHEDNNTKHYLRPYRMPASSPAKVVYDTEARTVEVTCNYNMQRDVYIYNAEGNVEAYYPTMNASLQLVSNGIHKIVIHGKEWYGEGEIEA